MATMGLVAHPMQNSIRNMMGTSFLKCSGLVMSKLRILDGLWKGDFNLEGIWVWREIQITDMLYARTATATWIPNWYHFASQSFYHYLQHHSDHSDTICNRNMLNRDNIEFWQLTYL